MVRRMARASTAIWSDRRRLDQVLPWQPSDHDRGGVASVTGKSNIEWTEQTWNPIVGCSIISPGCTNCYAMKMAARIQKMNRTSPRSGYINHYDGTTKKVNGNTIWTGKLAMAPDKLFLQPLSRKAP